LLFLFFSPCLAVDIKTFKKLSLEEKRAVREKKAKQKHKNTVKAKVSPLYSTSYMMPAKQIHTTCP